MATATPQAGTSAGANDQFGCDICLDENAIRTQRHCCSMRSCSRCLLDHVATQINSANVNIRCPNFGCNALISSEEIANLLKDSHDMKLRYDQFLADSGQNPHRKTCPRCKHITEISPKSLADCSRKVKKFGMRVVCENPDCRLVWCFACHAPWHEPVTCKDFKRGDKLLKEYAKQPQFDGTRNAVQCPNPKCGIYINRTRACPHMTCSKCKTEFCYKCGEKHRSFRFLGDHNSRRSIFGCKYIYDEGKTPVKRKLVRGAIFGGKLLGAAAVSPLAVVVLPFYGSYLLHKKVKVARQLRRRQRIERIELRYWHLRAQREASGRWSPPAAPPTARPVAPPTARPVAPPTARPVAPPAAAVAAAFVGQEDPVIAEISERINRLLNEQANAWDEEEREQVEVEIMTIWEVLDAVR